MIASFLFIHIGVPFSELLKPNGRFIKRGNLIKRTKYGKTLQKIAEVGADEFYSGQMAKQVKLFVSYVYTIPASRQLVEMAQCILWNIVSVLCYEYDANADSCYKVFSLTWPAVMQMYWNKRKFLHEKKTISHRICLLVHQHGRRFKQYGYRHRLKTLYKGKMAHNCQLLREQ